jgi:hypothetical protein
MKKQRWKVVLIETGRIIAVYDSLSAALTQAAKLGPKYRVDET